MAYHAFGRLHRGNLVLRVDRSRVADPRREVHDVHAKKMLVNHSRPQSISIRFGRRITPQVLKHAQQPGMRIDAALGGLDLPIATPQRLQLRRNELERVIGVLELLFQCFKDTDPRAV